MRILARRDTIQAIRYYQSKVQGCKTSLITHLQACLIMYNQTSCLLTQPCLPQRQHFEGKKIIILMGMMSRYAAEATLSSPADKQTLKQSGAISPEIELGCRDKIKHKKVVICVFNSIFIYCKTVIPMC